MSEEEKFPGSRPTVWVLASPGAGDNAQLRTVSTLIASDPVWYSDFDPLHRVVVDRIGGRPGRHSNQRLRSGKGMRFSPPWPDLVLIAGGRQVIKACRIREASGGRTRVVCLGRPWAALSWFDLIVTTPQYRLPEDANVLMLDLPLNAPPAESDAARRHWHPKLADLPRPLLGVLLGGESGSFRLSRRYESAIAARVQQVASARSAGVVIVDSPRSPDGLAHRIAERLTAPVRVCSSRDRGPNPYATVIGLSDALLVTEDSVSMLADAVHAGKPVAVVDLQERLHARVSRWLRQTIPGVERIGRALARRGLWCPPRDLRALRSRLLSRGLLQEPDDVLVAPDSRGNPLEEARSRLVSRVAELLTAR